MNINYLQLNKRKGNINKIYMKNCESNIIKNNILEMECPHAPTGQPSTSISVGQPSTSIPPVGQASRLSNKSWKRHLPHFQLSASYYFITLVTYNRTLLQPLQKDCIFNTLNFLNGK